MGFISQAKRGIFWTFLQQFSVQIINFIVQIILARLLMPADFGLIAMIAVFIAIGQSLMDSGMTSSLIRSKNISEKDFSTVFVTNLVVSILIYAIVFISAPYVGVFYDQTILSSLLRVFALSFVFNSFSAVHVARLSKELNFRDQFKFQLPSVIFGALVGIGFAYLGYGVWSLVFLNVVQAFIFAVSLWLFSNWYPRIVFDKASFLRHFEFGYKLTLSSLLNTIYQNLYKILIGKYFSVSSVGYFTQADNLRLFPVRQLSTILSKVTYPLFASIDDDIKLKKAYKSTMMLVLSLTSAMMIVLILIAEPLFLTVFGTKWLPSVPYFKILCFASITYPIGTYNLNILNIKGRSDLFLKVEVIKKIIGVGCLVVFIGYGINAIVWSLCVTNILFAYLNGYFSGKLIDYYLKEQIFDSIKVLVLALIPGVILYFIIPLVKNNISDVFVIIGYPVLYSLLYIVLVYLFNKELLFNIRLILKR